MTRLVLAALVGLISLAAMAGTASAAPKPPVHCTGTNSVWDDTDIVHLTKEGAGTLILAWAARGHTTLNCGSNSPLTGQVAQIEQQVHVRVGPNGAVAGRGRTRVSAGNLHHVFAGRFSGTSTLNQGTLNIAGDFNGDGDVDGRDYFRMREHGSINVAARQWTGFYIDDFIIGVK